MELSNISLNVDGDCCTIMSLNVDGNYTQYYILEYGWQYHIVKLLRSVEIEYYVLKYGWRLLQYYILEHGWQHRMVKSLRDVDDGTIVGVYVMKTYLATED